MKAFIFFVIAILAILAPFSSGYVRRTQNRMKHRGNIPLITGGKEAIPHSAPWQAYLIGHMSNNEEVQTCGGTLLGVNTVVTAAHCCVSGPDTLTSITVILGAHNINGTEESRQEIMTSKIIVHPDYFQFLFLPRNDICILILAEDAKLNYEVNTISLPTLSQAHKEDFSNYEATATGWGDTMTSDEKSNILKTTKLTILSKDACQRKYDEVIPSPKPGSILVSPSTICATGLDDSNICHGDGGGPLTVINKKGNPILVGITSTGLGTCSQPLGPSTFTRVTSYMEWISDVTGIEIRRRRG